MIIKAEGSTNGRIRVIKHMDFEAAAGMLTLNREEEVMYNVTFDTDGEEVHQSEYLRVALGTYE